MVMIMDQIITRGMTIREKSTQKRASSSGTPEVDTLKPGLAGKYIFLVLAYSTPWCSRIVALNDGNTLWRALGHIIYVDYDSIK